MRFIKLLAVIIVLGVCLPSCGEDEPSLPPDSPENPGGGSHGQGTGGYEPIKHQHSITAYIDYSESYMGRRVDENIWMIDVVLSLDNMVTASYYTRTFESTLSFRESASVFYSASWEGYDYIHSNISRYKSYVEVTADYEGRYKPTVTHKIHLDLITPPGVETLTLQFDDNIWVDMEYDYYGNETEEKFYGDDFEIKVDMSRIRIGDETWKN